MNFYEKQLNFDILETLNQTEDTVSNSRNRSVMSNKSNSVGMVKAQVNIGRISPMLKSIVQNESCLPK